MFLVVKDLNKAYGTKENKINVLKNSFECKQFH